MREILFRGKRKDNLEWVEGYLYRLSEKQNPFIMVKDKCGESYEVTPETVGEHTGLTDKNNKKIFEVREIVERQQEEINRLQSEKDDLFYKLAGVMHSVDKWLDGDELKQDEVNRAATMREKTLQMVKTLQAENESLKRNGR